MERLKICGFAAMAAGLFSFPALAQDMQVGKGMFVERCAVCHGETGAGDDVVGGLFTQKPKDLQLLAKENNGEFPNARVYRSIDGRLDTQRMEIPKCRSGATVSWQRPWKTGASIQRMPFRSWMHGLFHACST